MENSGGFAWLGVVEVATVLVVRVDVVAVVSGYGSVVETACDHEY